MLLAKSRLMISLIINLFLFTQVVVIVGGQQLSPQQQKQPLRRFDLTNEFVRKTYCGGIGGATTQNLVSKPDSYVRIASKPDMTLKEVRAVLAQNRRARVIEITDMSHLFVTSNSETTSINSSLVSLPVKLGDLFFSHVDVHHSGMNDSFALECLNLTSNGIRDTFLSTGSIHESINELVASLVTRLRVLQLGGNRFELLDRQRLRVFEQARLEVLIVDNNRLSSVRHDSFAGFVDLKYVSLANNRIKLIHPLTLTTTPNLIYLNLASNRLQAVFRTPNENAARPNASQSISPTLKNLKYLYLIGKNYLLKIRILD